MLMKLFLFTLSTLLLGGMFGCSSNQSPQQPSTQTPQTTQQAQNPQSTSGTADGKALYDANCASCHGAEGKGGSASALNTGGKLSDVITTTKNGIDPVMPSYKTKLNENEIKAIGDYVVSLKK